MSMSMPLLTDLYQLTMAQAYLDRDMRETAVFELAVRKLPANRRFLVAAGLEQAIDYLENLSFSAEDVRYLQDLGIFSQAFLDHLATLRFTGTLHAMPEGTPFFANEPILRVTAPLPVAQLVESRLLNIIHFQTLIASKAVRCVLAARGKPLVDFGMRRAHEAGAALFAARAAYLVGFGGTATVEAGRRFGIPLSGTMAHSFIEAHASEQDAFRHFMASRPEGATLLIDTYDTARAAHRVTELAAELAARNPPAAIHAVRIDSGDLARETRRVRDIFDRAGYPQIRIVLSGGLDEYRIDRLLRDEVPVDGFGVGTAVDVSDDAPALDMAYKLQAYAGKPRRKRSPGKVSWPGVKQVFRERGAQGEIAGDCLGLEGETVRGLPLLAEVMRDGRRARMVPTLQHARDACRREIEALPRSSADLLDGGGQSPIAVHISDALQGLVSAMDAAGD
jgi:nicotinate phosphoribosyltransferase